MEEDFFKKMGESTQFGANLSNLRNADETEKVRELLEKQQKEQQRQRVRNAALPDCPYCGTKIPKTGVKICGQCRSELAWVGKIPCEPGHRVALEKKIKREEAEKQKRLQHEARIRRLEEEERQKQKRERQKWLKTEEGVRYTQQLAEEEAKKQAAANETAAMWGCFGIGTPLVFISVATVGGVLHDRGTGMAPEVGFTMGLIGALGFLINVGVVSIKGLLWLFSDIEDPHEKPKEFESEEWRFKEVIIKEPVSDSIHPAQIWIKRGERVSGPFSPEYMRKLFKNKKIRVGDMLSNAENGPWKPVSK
ncbi:hypothetical protein N9Z44_01075 [Mariniblastus sp.]|nr:hypothetical protein [Mariniblastus sp.]